MSFWRDMVSAAGTQGRVVHALMLREIKSRFGRQKLGYIWAFLQPCAFIALFAFVFAAFRMTAPSGMPLVLFMITGFGPFFLFRNTMNETVMAIDANRVLLAFPQVKLIDLVLARALLEMATLTIVFFLILAAAYLLGHSVDIENPLRMLFALACFALTGFGLGAIFAAIAPLFRSTPQMVRMFAGRPLLFISGVFFTADMVPGAYREYALLNPLLHMMEWMRSAFFVQFESPHMSLDYAIGTALFTVFFGLLLLRGLNKRILAAV
jgi:capsular polysaccharide transport system permease protein